MVTLDNKSEKGIIASKNLQEVTGRTSSPAWNLWKPFTYCSIAGDLFQGSYSLKFEPWYSLYIADQDTARYSLCSAREYCVSWAEPLKCTTDYLFSSRVLIWEAFIYPPWFVEDRKWCGLIAMIGSLQLTNQVAVGSIRVFPKLGCVFLKVYRTIFDPLNKPGWIYKRLPNQAIRNSLEFTSTIPPHSNWWET